MKMKIYDKPYFTLSMANCDYKVRTKARELMVAHKRYRKRFPTEALAEAAAESIAADIGYKPSVGEVFGGLSF